MFDFLVNLLFNKDQGPMFTAIIILFLCARRIQSDLDDLCILYILNQQLPHSLAFLLITLETQKHFHTIDEHCCLPHPLDMCLGLIIIIQSNDFYNFAGKLFINLNNNSRLHLYCSDIGLGQICLDINHGIMTLVNLFFDQQYNLRFIISQYLMFGKLFDGSTIVKRQILQNKVRVSSKGQRRGGQKEEDRLLDKHKAIKKDRNTVNLTKSYAQLKGAKFRILNEMLYKNESQEAAQYFQSFKQDFQLYHQGYRHQTTKWSYRPVDQVINYIVENKSKYMKRYIQSYIRNIGDLGCGQGFIFEQLTKHGFTENRIKSYDLVSIKPFIKQADIANLPLKDQTMGLCIFSLSLMGTNYIYFIQQAHRVLKKGGELLISEVQSRSKNWPLFIDMVKAMGFKLINDGLNLMNKVNNDEARFFRTMHFKKTDPICNLNNKMFFQGQKLGLQALSAKLLQICEYKKR